MAWARLRNGRAAHRIGAIDSVQFPTSVCHCFALHHRELGDDDIGKVEAGTRQ
jgi:hypothetical protein